MRIFITGATTGIGFSLAKSYLMDGHTVGICGRNLDKLPEGFSSTYSKAKLYEVDVLDQRGLANAIESFSEEGLDLIIANAGRSVGKKTKEPNFEVGREVIQTNVIGVMNTFEPAYHVMAKAGHGHMVAVSSVAGFVGLPGSASYCASKAAVTKLCESFSIDFSSVGIDVSVIAPGFVDTPLTRQNNHAMPWLMDADQAVGIIRKGLENKEFLIMFPWQMKWLITFLNKIPRNLYRFLMKFSKYNQ